MKNLVRAAVLAITLLAASFVSSAKEVQPSFSDTLSKATLAVYSGKQVCQYKTVESFFGPFDVWSCEFKSNFTCTATIVSKDGFGNFVGLTAGHCFSYELMEKGGEKYYISDSLDDKPVLHEIHLVKFANDARYDFAIFEFRSIRDYPVIEILQDGEAVPPIGTQVLNVNFSLGVTKQLLEGKVVSNQFENGGGRACDHECGARYFVSIGVGPGASGSAVVDLKTHKIIGMVEAVFPSTQMATIVVPMGTRFVDFMDDASTGIKPQEPPQGVKVRQHVVPKSSILQALWQFFFGD